MIEIAGNLWDALNDVDAIVISTNGDVKKDNHAILGRGCASEASTRFPTLSKHLGAALVRTGNHVYVFPLDGETRCKYLVTFPVKPGQAIIPPAAPQSLADSVVLERFRTKLKPGQIVYGYMHKASLKLIRKSALELLHVTTAMRWQKVAMPKPGCGAGALEWTVVKLTLADVLGPDARFIIYDNAKEE